MAVDIDLRIAELRELGGELQRGITEAREAAGANPDAAERLRRAGVLIEQANAALARGGDPASAALMGRLRSGLAQVVDRLAGSTRTAQAASTPSDHDGIRGTSGSVSIPDLLGFLQVQGKSGRLEVALPDERISLHVSRGDLVAARSDRSPPGSRLGEILVDMGAIERATLDAFVVFHSRTEPIGQALELHELVSKKQLHDALAEQALRIVQRLMDTAAARFEFHEEPADADDRDYRLNVVELLLESARQCDERAHRAGEAPPPALPSEAVPSERERTSTF